MNPGIMRLHFSLFNSELFELQAVQLFDSLRFLFYTVESTDCSSQFEQCLKCGTFLRHVGTQRIQNH